MHDKILEIIVFILSRAKTAKQFTDFDVSDLTKKGYSSSEINTAFAWIYAKIKDENIQELYKNVSTDKSKRFFHKNEKELLTPESEGYIIQMKELGIIDEADIESILEKIINIGYLKAGIREVKEIISSILFNAELKNGSSRLILHNNDTIH